MSNIRTLYLGLDITRSKCVLVELMYRFHLKDSPAIYFLMKCIVRLQIRLVLYYITL